MCQTPPYISLQTTFKRISVQKCSVGDPNPNPNPKGSERFKGSESDQIVWIRLDSDPKGSEGKFYLVKHILKGKIHLRGNKYALKNVLFKFSHLTWFSGLIFTQIRIRMHSDSDPELKGAESELV